MNDQFYGGFSNINFFFTAERKDNHVIHISAKHNGHNF